MRHQNFNGETSTHYMSKVKYRSVYDGGDMHLCADICYKYLTGEMYDEDDSRFVNWGYYGRSPELLSIGLLACAVGQWDFEELCNVVLDWDDGGPPPRNRTYVLRRHKKFTQQITSKLPDNWEMTTDEINAWIKDHKQLPACIRNQTKTKGKQYGKAETKERESSVV